jgi:hypothetical protein
LNLYVVINFYVDQCTLIFILYFVYFAHSQVIGDKKVGKTTLLFQRDPQKYSSMLQEIRQEVKIPIKFLHVVRNPFDNMATMALRRHFGYSLNWTKMYESPVSINYVTL